MQMDRRKPTALTDWAYHTIKQAILSLEFAPGSQLPIDELAERLGISRTPVREALLRLEAEGLIHTAPRVGYFVTKITRRDLEELFELRQLLESHATRKATALLSEDDLAYADRLLAESEAGVERGELEKFQQAEIAFHNLFVERAQNQRLVAMMGTLYDLTYRQRMLSLQSLDNVRQSIVEHRRIVETLRRRDGELAGQRMAEHVAAARDRLLQFVVLPESNEQAGE